MRHARRAFDLPVVPGLGYHAFSLVEAGSGALIASTQLIVCPARCFQPRILADGGRIWGPALQLYALRSARNWGIGDLADLRTLVEFAGQAGAGIVGVNPLHALFPDRPDEASPYRPSNRRRRNVLYLAVEAIRFGECPPLASAWQAPEFPGAARGVARHRCGRLSRRCRRKFEVLELLYRHFRQRHLPEHRAREGLSGIPGWAANRCGCTRCSRRCKAFSRADPAAGAGPHGRKRTGPRV